jgi:hypothetical protein
MKLTELEIAKIFAKYPLCPVRIYDGDPGEDPATDKVEGIIFDIPMVYCEKISRITKQVKLVQKALHHLTNKDLIEACRCFDNTPMVMHPTITVMQKEDDPAIKRIVCDCSTVNFVYHFDITNGNITLFKDGKPFTYTNRQARLVQWYYEHYVAIPVYLDFEHWANDKTPIDLGIAEPDPAMLVEILHKKFNKDTALINQWFFNKRLEGLTLTSIGELDNAINELLNG